MPSINRWIGQAQPVQAQAHLVPGNVEPGCEYAVAVGASITTYRYPDIRPAADDTQKERRQRVVNELVALLGGATSFIGGGTSVGGLSYEISSFNGNPSIEVIGDSNGAPITLQVSAVAPTSAPIVVSQMQEGSAGGDYIFTLTYPAVPTGGYWQASYEGNVSGATPLIAHDANAATVRTSLLALGLPCTTITVTGSHTAGYTVTLGVLTKKIDYPPIEIIHQYASSIEGCGGYRVELVESTGNKNQINLVPFLDSSEATLYRFEFQGRYSNYFTGASGFAEVNAAADALWGPGNVAFGPDGEDRGLAIMEFVGQYSLQSLTINLETNRSLSELAVIQEPSDKPTLLKQRFIFTNGTLVGYNSRFKLTGVVQAPGGASSTYTTAFIGTEMTATQIQTALTSVFPLGTIASVTKPSDLVIEIESLGLEMITTELLIKGPTIEVVATGKAKAQELQQIVIKDQPTGGTFTLTYGVNTTTGIAYNATATTVATALNALASITSAGGVTVVGADGGPYLVRFTSFAAVTKIAANGASLTLSNVPSFTRTDTVTGTGPNYFDNAANWSLGHIPADGELIVYSDGATDCLYNIAQPAITPFGIDFYLSFIGRVGLPENRDDGSRETLYRYLRLGNAADGQPATIINVGLGDDGNGSGPSLIRLDMGDQAFVAFIRNLQTGAGVSGKALSILGTAATNKAYVQNGDVAFGLYPDDLVTLAELQLLPSDISADQLSVMTGDGATIGTVTMSGGRLDLANPAKAMMFTGGSAKVRGSGQPWTIDIQDASLEWFASGDVGKSGSISAISISSGVATVTSNGHALASGDRVNVRGVSGVVGLDGKTFAVNVVNANSFVLIGSNCSGSYTGSGMKWGLVEAIVIRTGSMFDFDQDVRSRDIVSPVLLHDGGVLRDTRGTITDLRIWPEQIDFYDPFGRNIELRRVMR